MCCIPIAILPDGRFPAWSWNGQPDSFDSFTYLVCCPFFSGFVFTKICCCAIIRFVRGISAAGSAPQWHCGGHRFDSDMLHQRETLQDQIPAGFFLLIWTCGSLSLFSPFTQLWPFQSPMRMNWRNSLILIRIMVFMCSIPWYNIRDKTIGTDIMVGKKTELSEHVTNRKL